MPDEFFVSLIGWPVLSISLGLIIFAASPSNFIALGYYNKELDAYIAQINAMINSRNKFSRNYAKVFLLMIENRAIVFWIGLGGLIFSILLLSSIG